MFCYQDSCIQAAIEEKEKRKRDPSKKKDKSKKVMFFYLFIFFTAPFPHYSFHSTSFHSTQDKETRRQLKLEEKERTLRARLLKKYQQVGQQQLEEQRERVRQMLQASTTKLKSAFSVIPEPIATYDKAAPTQFPEQTPFPVHEQEVER